VRLERRGEVRFVEQAAGARVDAHAALFHDHVTLGVELAEDRMRHPVRLEHEPQLRAVRGELDEVERRLVRRHRIQALRAVARQDLIELVRHDQRARRVFELVDAVAEAAHRGRIGAGPARGHHRVVRRVDTVEPASLRRGIARAHGRGPLEQQVLEQVGDARRADVLVHAADIELRNERDRGRPVPAEQEEAHPVLEHDLAHGQLIAAQRLAGHRRGERPDQADRGERARERHRPEPWGWRGAPRRGWQAGQKNAERLLSTQAPNGRATPGAGRSFRS
jgi:hypothetical protein